MRVLYHHRIRSKDGQYVHVEELIRALRELGHEVSIVGPSAMDREEFGGESKALTWLKRRMPRFLYELLEFSYCFIDFARLSYRIQRYDPDLVYERYSLFLPSGVWASKILGVPLFLEVNAPLFQERAEHGGIALRGLARWTQQVTWRGATKCLPVTQVLASYLTDVGVPTSAIAVVPNGIDEDVFLSDQSRESRDNAVPEPMSGSVVLGFVGFVRSWHGMDDIVALLADPSLSEQRLSLLVVGDGPARPSLEKQAKEIGVADRIHFTGIVEREQIISYLRCFDIALQPMVVEYASPLKLFEYMATGRAIVAPDRPNIREVLADEHDAILFDPEDAESRRHAIVRLAANVKLRERLGANAKRTITQRGYTWRRNAEEITRMFTETRQVALDSGPGR